MWPQECQCHTVQTDMFRKVWEVTYSSFKLKEELQFEHLGTEATLSDGTKFPMRAEVGILSRNVRIIGKDYDDIEDERFGARVLVGVFEQEGTEYLGYGRFSNVELTFKASAIAMMPVRLTKVREPYAGFE